MISEGEQIQYKVQLLLHINSVLLARVIQMTNNAGGGNAGTLPEQVQSLASQYLKRVHANLQCISQINQGAKGAKPLILEPPQLLVQLPGQDILAKLYLLMSRVFEIW
ncbi:SNF11 (YDR073W) [Zygosaccharomyces parabailii]|uniref:ZYBA0S05-08350g1_1 n=1 Tax=Zygosaccharomyces bailii (strain CLIB 213 / ATCC 58445 / CBS 680 / BCRC 21525 / NBRC 1098 / NCYC 1416 / NRRL Y-2227) TaxID=1333698 RepID=A0A8J2T827_ZYGB2|nr:SNF11 (YDR073W) [Zygosaccharomyces parabailii]CDF90072.1 ZYBA0S05-08350g1_1 [Zygosaccharomyces bailii CLIB 213]CDH15239.1 related to Transcription regulatory protein SNF11 [Zygosaccharomyces bailii ISA1307]SJM87306.1 related to Transcription regulatory protein SNF11 [Zygosaccharomyces bailii]